MRRGLTRTKCYIFLDVGKLINTHNMSEFKKIWRLRKLQTKLNNVTLNHDAVQRLVRSKETFDIVIYDYAANEALLGLSHVFQSSSILFVGGGANFETNSITRNSFPSSYIPHPFLMYEGKMSMWQRFKNGAVSLFSDALIQIAHLPSQKSIYTRYFPKAPKLDQILKNVSLLLYTSHLSVETAKPFVPTMIDIGGFHVEEAKQLPEDLKNFLDEATQGAVYINFGSSLGPERNKVILETIANLPFRVLWKTDLDDLGFASEKVKTSKWVPQNDVLGVLHYTASFHN